MLLQRLQLQNFRGFADATVDFERDLTVLVGVNGAGKSSILECVASLLTPWLRRVLDGPGEDSGALRSSDVRSGASQATCVLDAMWGHVPVRLEEHHPPRPHSNPLGPRSMREVVYERSMGRDPLLPCTFLYSVDRALSGDEPIGEPRAVERQPASYEEARERDLRAALTDSLRSRSTRFNPFLAWFREREDLENEERIRLRSFDHEDRQLAGVRRALQGMLPGVSAPAVHRATRSLVVTKGGVELALNQLSDGERGLFAMVGDLARRLTLIDPRQDDSLLREAVVLIDEIELHLHPAWQREVPRALRRTFPNVQFVLTTHSPQVIGEVPARCIRVVRDGRVEPAPAPTEGRDSNRILEVLMGAPSRSAEVAALFARLATAEDEERWGDAWALVDRLRDRLGDDDPDVSRHTATLPARDAAAAE